MDRLPCVSIESRDHTRYEPPAVAKREPLNGVLTDAVLSDETPPPDA